MINGFYEELKELQEDYPEANFGFLENTDVTSESHAHNFLHGCCDEFVAMLSEMYGYEIECVRNSEGRLVHAYCITDVDGEKAYIDVRGTTTDPVLFFEEFENEITYYPEDGTFTTLNDDSYEVEAVVEAWKDKDSFFDGEYVGWSDEEIKQFIREQGSYYNPNRIREGVFAKQMFFHVTLMENVDSIREKGLLPQIGERSEEIGETEENIYLFTSYEAMDNALMNWLGEWYNENYGEECDLAVLKVLVPPEIEIIDEGVGYEVICKERIPAEYISFYDELGNELEQNYSFKTVSPACVGEIYHVGTMDITKKSNYSLEGNGLSVSNCPDVWRRITEGTTHGDTYLLSKPNMKLLDFYALKEEEKSSIKEWAIKEGYVVPGTLYKYMFGDEEGNECYSLFATREEALCEADEDCTCVEDVEGLLPTDKLINESMVKVELLCVMDLITSLYAERMLKYDGVYWDESLDLSAYSAPRGMIFNSKLASFHMKNVTKEKNPSLDARIENAVRENSTGLVGCKDIKKDKLMLI